MTNSEKLLSLYNDFDAILRKKYHETNRSNSVIARFTSDLAKSNIPEYQKMAKKINMVRIIRNTLIHELDMNSEKLIEVSDETISLLEEINYKLMHPKEALDFATSLEHIYSKKISELTFINIIVKEMREKGFSQVPILKEDNSLEGVFSPNALFAYLNDHPKMALDNLTIQDIDEYLPIEKHFSESYVFVRSDMTDDELTNIFIKAYSSNQKLAMAFVTKYGQKNEPILGIIVLRDLLRE